MSTMQAAGTSSEHVVVEEATAKQGVALFDSRCHALLGISAEEFLTAFDAGQYPADWAEQYVVELEMLLPFAH